MRPRPLLPPARPGDSMQGAVDPELVHRQSISISERHIDATRGSEILQYKPNDFYSALLEGSSAPVLIRGKGFPSCSISIETSELASTRARAPPLPQQRVAAAPCPWVSMESCNMPWYVTKVDQNYAPLEIHSAKVIPASEVDGVAGTVKSLALSHPLT